MQHCCNGPWMSSLFLRKLFGYLNCVHTRCSNRFDACAFVNSKRFFVIFLSGMWNSRLSTSHFFLSFLLLWGPYVLGTSNLLWYVRCWAHRVLIQSLVWLAFLLRKSNYAKRLCLYRFAICSHLTNLKSFGFSCLFHSQMHYNLKQQTWRRILLKSQEMLHASEPG